MSKITSRTPIIFFTVCIMILHESRRYPMGLLKKKKKRKKADLKS